MRRVLPAVLCLLLLAPLARAQDARPSEEDRKLDESLERALKEPDQSPPPAPPVPEKGARDDDKDHVRLTLDALAAQWSARIYRATAVGRAPGSSLREQPATTFLDESYGPGNMYGELSETQLYRAFVGVHFANVADLGLEVAGRTLVARDGRAVPIPFQFAGHSFAFGEPLDSRFSYRCLDADCLTHAWPESWFGLEGGFGFSYLYTHVTLRDVLSGNGAQQSLESLALMFRFGLAVRPVHTDVFSLELFARVRAGGMPGTYQCGLEQTEVGVSLTFFDSFGIMLGHHFERAQLERHLATPVPDNLGPITDKRAEIGAEGPFLAIFAGF
jgi:hypothetical protein